MIKISSLLLLAALFAATTPIMAGQFASEIYPQANPIIIPDVTYRVPGDYPTCEEAIAATRSDDAFDQGGTITIEYRASEYEFICGNLNFPADRGKSWHIQGELGPNGERPKIRIPRSSGGSTQRFVIWSPLNNEASLVIENLEVTGLRADGITRDCSEGIAVAAYRGLIVRNFKLTGCRGNGLVTDMDHSQTLGPDHFRDSFVEVWNSEFAFNGFSLAHNLYLEAGRILVDGLTSHSPSGGHALAARGNALVVIRNSDLANTLDDGPTPDPDDPFYGAAIVDAAGCADVLFHNNTVTHYERLESENNLGRDSTGGHVVLFQRRRAMYGCDVFKQVDGTGNVSYNPFALYLPMPQATFDEITASYPSGGFWGPRERWYCSALGLANCFEEERVQQPNENPFWDRTAPHSWDAIAAGGLDNPENPYLRTKWLWNNTFVERSTSTAPWSCDGPGGDAGVAFIGNHGTVPNICEQTGGCSSSNTESNRLIELPKPDGWVERSLVMMANNTFTNLDHAAVAEPVGCSSGKSIGNSIDLGGSVEQPISLPAYWPGGEVAPTNLIFDNAFE